MATSQAYRKFRAIISTGVKGNSLLIAGNEITTVATLSLIIFSIIVVGCATKPSMNQFPELEARQPSKVKLGQELILLENPPMLSTGLIGTDGAAHLFLIDEDKRLNHLKILGDGIITREFLGVIETAESWTALDAVEHPQGSLRVLAGDRQYFRKAPNLKWREIKGNRCARFVPVDDNLFCAFVIKGEEIDAPERTDYTVGWFILLPIVLWSDKHVPKLVLAQESQDGWIVRAVLDPDTPWDANTDFMVGSDSLGNLYFLYFTSKGGGYFFVIAGGHGVSYGGGSSAPDPKLRFAKLKIDQLLTHSGNAQNLAKNQDKNPMQWIKIKGTSLPHKPFIQLNMNNQYARINLRPVNRNFLVNKVMGNISGLMWASQCTLDGGKRQLQLNRYDHLWIELNFHNGKLTPNFDIVTANDFPTSDCKWWDHDVLIKTDHMGNYHLLLTSLEEKSGKSRSYMNYLLKDAGKWSVPLKLGGRHQNNHVLSFAVNDSGVSFAAWVNEQRKFIGRWIKPDSDDLN